MFLTENDKRSAHQHILSNSCRVQPTWQKQLDKRSQLYWQCNNTEKVILPNKLLLKHLPNEPKEEWEIRKDAALRKLRDEINLLKIRAERHKQNYQKVDAEMTTFLEAHFTNKDLTDIEDLWCEEIANQERKSSQRWLEKQYVCN